MAGENIKKLKRRIKYLKDPKEIKKYLDKRSPQWLNYAKGLAPMKTGAIKENVLLSSLDAFGSIIYRITAYQPINSRDRPYLMWHHGITSAKAPNGKSYDLRSGRFAPKSGIPDFMFKLHERVSNELAVDKISKLVHEDVNNILKIR